MIKMPFLNASRRVVSSNFSQTHQRSLTTLLFSTSNSIPKRHLNTSISLSKPILLPTSVTGKAIALTPLLQNVTSFSTQIEPDHIPLPPNLKFDPKCISTPYYGLEEVRTPETEAPEDTEDVADDISPPPTETTSYRYFDTTTAPTPPIAIPLPERLHVPIFDFTTNEKIGTIHLSSDVFGMNPIREDLIHRVVIYQRNKKRGKRTARTKRVGEVSGSGRKVRPQKGQGRARAGHSRPSHWRGGAKAHGPRGIVQDYTTKLNKKIRRLGLRHALSQKLLEGNLILVGDFNVESHKTKDLAKIFDNYDVSGKYGTSAYVLDEVADLEKEDHQVEVDDEEDEDSDDEEETMNGCSARMKVASKNLPKVKMVNQKRTNVYDVLKYEKLILSLKALQFIEKRLGE